MSGVAAAATRRADSDYALDRGPADIHPVPSILDTVAASVRTSRDAQPAVQRDRVQDAYAPVVDTLVKALGGSTSDYTPDWLHYDPLHPIDAERAWQGVERARARGIALPDLPATQAEFEHGAVNRGGGFEQDEATLSRSGTISRFVGGAIGGFTDPRNLATGVLTGGWSKGLGLARGILVDGLGNAGAEALQISNVDDRAAHRRLFGKDLTLGEGAEMVAEAGAFGGLFHVGGRAVPAAARFALDNTPLGPLIDRFKQTVPEHIQTPDERAALHTAEQVHETDSTSPYTDTHAGTAAHTSQLQAALDAIQGEPAPLAPVAAAVPQTAPRAPGQVGPWQSVAVNVANQFGLKPSDVAAVMSYETGGTFSPTKMGGKGGRYMGLIQFGPPERAKYGITSTSTPEQWTAAITGFLHDRGFKRGMGVLDLYSTINAGRPGRYNASDGNGTVRSHVDKILAEHLGNARGWLGREGDTAAADGGAASTFEAPALAASDFDAELPIVSAGGRDIPITSFAPGEIGVDAKLMQFKSGGDARGVTDRLHGVQQWDPLAAGMATVWEGNDGRRLIADGHQRLGLANRMLAADPAQDIRLNAFVLREADGFSASDARVLTALKNIGEGTGTATDAAKVLRDVGLGSDAVARRLPPRSALIRDGKALAQLSPEAFGAVVNDVIPESYGAVIGALAPDRATHAALVDVLHATAPETRKQAEAIVRQALDAGFTAEHQAELFGMRSTTNALYASKALALDRTLAELRKMKGAFQVAARNADTLESAGNSISVNASEAAAAGNARALALVDRLALRKGNAVSALFNEAAQRLADGEQVSRVVKSLVGDLQRLDLADVDRAVRATGDAGERPVTGGSDAHAAQADGERELSPAERDELEAAGQVGFGFDDPKVVARFDDPAGDGVKVAADSAWHDIVDQAKATVDQSAASDDGLGPSALLSFQPKDGRPGVSVVNDESHIASAVFRDESGTAQAIVQMPISGEGRAVSPEVLSYVRPTFRRQGIATRLYDALAAKGHNVDALSGTGDLTPDGAAFVNARRAKATDPNIAARQRQETKLRADAPMRGENRTRQAQDGTLGSPLFDSANAPRFDLEDGRGARSIAEIHAELDAERSGIDAIRGCLL